MSNSSSSGKDEKTQADHARHALELKQKAERERETQTPQSRTAGEGQIQETRADVPPMGALDAEGHRPVLERSRKVR
jgi:hypothetical protein